MTDGRASARLAGFREYVFVALHGKASNYTDLLGIRCSAIFRWHAHHRFVDQSGTCVCWGEHTKPTQYRFCWTPGLQQVKMAPVV